MWIFELSKNKNIPELPGQFFMAPHHSLIQKGLVCFRAILDCFFAYGTCCISTLFVWHGAN